MTNVVGEQPALWQDRVLLDEDFYRALKEHPVPVSETALRAIGPRSMVIDVYIWLAYRLHALKKGRSQRARPVKSSYSNGMVDPPKQARNANVATGGLPVDNQKLRGITEWAGTFSVPCRRWTASRSTTAVRFAPPQSELHFGRVV